MIDCCVAKLEEMHGIANYFWWFQRFILASPFILIIPDLDPTSGTGDLLQTGLQKSGEMAYTMASNVVYKNKSLPDFVDAVKNIGRLSYGQLRDAATSHGTLHITKDKSITNFWFNMARAYDDAFSAR